MHVEKERVVDDPPCSPFPGKKNPENSKHSVRQEISQFHSELGITLLVAKEEGKRGPLRLLAVLGGAGEFLVFLRELGVRCFMRELGVWCLGSHSVV